MSEAKAQPTLSETQRGLQSPVSEAVHRYVEAQHSNAPILVVNPGHGNEPYILGTKIAVSVSKKLRDQGFEQPRIVVPLLYGDRQRQILLEVLGEDAELVHMDEQFGEMLRPIVFGSSDFSGHLQQLTAHYDGVQRLIDERFSGNFETGHLTSDQRTQFASQNVVASVDAGSRILVNAPLRYFAFPALLSEVLQAAKKKGLEFPGISDAYLGALIERMLKVESQYAQVFIPRVNTFSYEHADDLSQQPGEVNGRSRIYTPAMKPKIQSVSSPGFEQPGVFVMYSGNESGIELTQKVADAAREAGLAVYTNQDANPSDVMKEENVEAIFGRSGWGTGWQAINLAKPWIVNPYESNDDPEIYFNNLTIEALKLGRVLRATDLTPEKLHQIMAQLQQLSPGLHALRDRIKQEFGTVDGIDYTAEQIVKDILETRGKGTKIPLTKHT